MNEAQERGNKIPGCWNARHKKTLRLILEKFTVVGHGAQIKKTVDNFIKEQISPPGRRITVEGLKAPYSPAHEKLEAQRADRIIKGVEEGSGVKVIQKPTPENAGVFMREERSIEELLDDSRDAQRARQDAERAYRIATERAGEAGVKFLDGLKLGKTKRRAAKDAGIPRTTAYRLINEIEADFKA